MLGYPQSPVLRIRIRWIRKILLPGSGSAKIGGSTYPDPKTEKKIVFSPKPQILTFQKREIIKISSFLNGSSSFRIKISEKNKTENLNFFVVKKIQ